MDNTRLIELLEQIKDTLIKGESYTLFGICAEVQQLFDENKIDEFEMKKLNKFIFKNKPTLDNEYAEFMNNQFWKNTGYWWNSIAYQPKTKQIRVDYLTKLIGNIK